MNSLSVKELSETRVDTQYRTLPDKQQCEFLLFVPTPSPCWLDNSPPVVADAEWSGVEFVEPTLDWATPLLELALGATELLLFITLFPLFLLLLWHSLGCSWSWLFSDMHSFIGLSPGVITDQIKSFLVFHEFLRMGHLPSVWVLSAFQQTDKFRAICAQLLNRSTGTLDQKFNWR